MPPTRGASWMGEIDGGFACYVVLARDTFEVKVEERLGHVINIRK
jgi:threonine dehydrogenase-like Zn-dependent dehydrogenase